MKIKNYLIENLLNEMPSNLADSQRREWNIIQTKLFKEIAEKNGWGKETQEELFDYAKKFSLFGKIFADKYDNNFNKILSLSNENKKELERLLLEKLKK